jgi:hypothetical protein
MLNPAKADLIGESSFERVLTTGTADGACKGAKQA